jgi:cytoskeletal protein CcmA (bactofilin family)
VFSRDKSKEQPKPQPQPQPRSQPKSPPPEAGVTSKTGDLTVARPKTQKTAAMPSIISEGLHVTGNLSCDGDVQIDGRVDGDIDARSLTIGENGTVDGSITADEVHVSGTLNGEINARTVVIARSAHVRGDVAHDVLSIESGAQFEGKSARRAGTPVEHAAPAANVQAAPQPPQAAASQAAQPASKPLLSEVSGTGGSKAASAN